MRSEHRHRRQALVLRKDREQGRLPSVHVHDIGRKFFGEFEHALGKEDEARGVVLIIPVVRSVESGPVKKFIAGYKEDTHPARRGCLKNFRGEFCRADRN